MKRAIFAVISIVAVSSCTMMPSPVGMISGMSTITRWSKKTDEDVSRVIPVERHPDIFADFAWTTPSIKSVKVQDHFSFNGHNYSFAVSGETLSLTAGGRTTAFGERKSKGKYYYDISRLKYDTVSRQRWVPKTVFVTESVPVQKTRQVPQTSFDAKGMAHTSYRMEFYTDWEFRTTTKTNWVWETYYERVVIVPEAVYFDVFGESGDHFLIYKTGEDAVVSYYLQNPEYYLATEKNNTLFGVKDVALLCIDADSDGVFLSARDKILFNVWNPYSKDSRYRSIAQIMDNYWYQTGFISNNFFMDFALGDSGLAVDYANEKFIDGKAFGTVTVNNLPANLKAKVMINGKNYGLKSGKARKSEYGKYRMVISVPGHLDYESLYAIDGSCPQKTVDYELTAPAGTIQITNVFSPQYKVMVENASYSNVYFTPKAFNLPYGTFTLTVSVDGFQLVKEISVGDGATIAIDFEKELKALKQ